MKIIRLEGNDPQLYALVAPLVMNPAVLRQNNNYPFKTTPRHVWYVAVADDGDVVAFMPLKKTVAGYCIDNYYVASDDETLFDALIERIVAEMGKESLVAMVHKRHTSRFASHGFSLAHTLVKYDKMAYDGKSAT